MGFVSGRFQFVVVGRRVVVGVENLGFRHADADLGMRLHADGLGMGVIDDIGMAGGGVQYDGYLRKKGRHDEKTTLVVPGGSQQHAFVDDTACRCGFVGIFAHVHRAAVVDKLFIAGVIMYLGDITVNHAGGTHTAHTARSHLDTLDTASQCDFADRLLYHPPVVVL